MRARVALVLAVVALSSEAHAYCRSTTCQGDCPLDDDGCKATGEPLWWRTSCVGISLQKDASRYIPLDEARPAIVAALSEWSLRDCDGQAASIGFAEIDSAQCREPAFDAEGANANVIMFQDFKWGYSSADNALAKTTVSYDTKTGEILDADIEINHALNEITTSDDAIVNDLTAIVVHEIGHFIGLDHSPDPSAIMQAEHPAQAVSDRVLAPDDVAAVCAAYPPGRDAKCDTTPLGGFTGACSAPPTEDDGCTVAAPGRPERDDDSTLSILLGIVVLAAARRRH